MNKKEQTAVEWFQEQIIKIVNGECELSEIQIFEQAKKMEKEQILRSFSVGNDCGYCFAKTKDTQQYNSGEQYYNETYNK